MKNKNTYPTKRTINLAMREESPIRLSVLLPALAVIFLLAAGFTKVAVIDRLLAAYQTEWEASAAERRLEKLNQELLGYEQVETEYLRHFSEGLHTADTPLSVREILALTERNVMRQTSIGSLGVQGSTVSVELTGSDLAEASQIMGRLKQEPSVAAVTLFTANTGRDTEHENGATIFMTITLQEAQEE